MNNKKKQYVKLVSNIIFKQNLNWNFKESFLKETLICFMFQNSFNLSLDALILRWKLFPLVKGGEGQYGTVKKKKMAQILPLGHILPNDTTQQVN